MLEAFGCGTAAVICPIKEIGWKGKDIKIPLLPGEQPGPFAKQTVKWINDIQYGRAVCDNWSRVVADLNE